MKSKFISVLLVSLLLFSRSALAKTSEPVAELKSEIFNLAQSYQGQTDSDGSKTRALEVLIDRLLVLSPQGSMAQKAANAVGAWQQIWGPYIYNDNTKSTPLLDPANIYQIISPSGFYTNVGIYRFFGINFIGLLKGRYSVEPNEIAVQFVENGIVTESIPQGYGLADLPALYESGRLCVIDFPSIFPPVGIRGDLIETYSDADLRITYGTQEGKEGKTLYVLRRVKALNY